MNETPKATFSLQGYKISPFSFADSDIEQDGISVKFDPSGIFFVDVNQYLLSFRFTAFVADTDTELLSATMTATFAFENVSSLEEIPSYFYRNSIAIVFPYLRAFVSTITAVANIKPIILPVLNLSSLETVLMEATTQQELNKQ